MKIKTIYKKLSALYEELDILIDYLNEKKRAIEDNAFDKDREMTEREEEQYNDLDDKIEWFGYCLNHLADAIYDIEEYAE